MKIKIKLFYVPSMQVLLQILAFLSPGFLKLAVEVQCNETQNMENTKIIARMLFKNGE